MGADIEVRCTDNRNIGLDVPYRKFVDPWEHYDETQNTSNKNNVESIEPMLNEDSCRLEPLDKTNDEIITNNNLYFYSESNVPKDTHLTLIKTNEQADNAESCDYKENISEYHPSLTLTNTKPEESQAFSENNCCLVQISNDILINDNSNDVSVVPSNSSTTDNSLLIKSNLEQSALTLTQCTETASLCTDSTSTASNVNVSM